MFCDMVGSSALSTRLDPEEQGEVIAAFHACCASSHEVGPVDVAFIAYIFEHVRIRFVVHRHRQDQGLGQHFGIIESDLKLHVTEIDAPESLGNAQLLGMRMPCPV